MINSIKIFRLKNFIRIEIYNFFINITKRLTSQIFSKNFHLFHNFDHFFKNKTFERLKFLLNFAIKKYKYQKAGVRILIHLILILLIYLKTI